MCQETCDHEWGPVDELDRYHGAGEHTREERTLPRLQPCAGHAVPQQRRLRRPYRQELECMGGFRLML